MASLDNFILYDVAEAIITDKVSGEQFLNKFLTTSGITQSSSETEIRAGRGAGLIALIESEKSLEISLTNGVISKKWLEMQQGANFKEENITITKTETLEVAETEVVAPDPDAGIVGEYTYTITLKGTPLNTAEVTVINCDGENETNVTVGTGGITTLPAGFVKGGEKVTVIYKAIVENAEVLEIDSAVFPKGWELQLEVPAMDKCTQKVTHKVVFVFDNVRPSSSFDLSFAMGEAIAPEMTVKVMKSCCGTGLGKMAIVPIDTP